jgi:membrane-associated protein
MDSIFVLIENVSAFVATHTTLSYFLLFLGSYLEAIVGINFIVRGEFFFVIGSLLAGTGVLNVWLVSLALITGGTLGDSSSYWLGRKYGIRLLKEGRPVLNFENFKKASAFVEKYGAPSAFFARFLGPLSWVTPFILGAYKIPYSQFLVYNVPGAALGIGQFIVVGYFFASNYREVLALVQKYALFSVLGVIALILLLRYARIHRSELVEKVFSFFRGRRR